MRGPHVARAATREGRIAASTAAQFTCSVQLESIDPTKNRARFYTLAWQPTLWGGGALVCTWGRIGGRGRSLTHFFPDRESAQPLVERIIKRRLRRWYRVVAWH